MDGKGMRRMPDVLCCGARGVCALKDEDCTCKLHVPWAAVTSTGGDRWRPRRLKCPRLAKFGTKVSPLAPSHTPYTPPQNPPHPLPPPLGVQMVESLLHRQKLKGIEQTCEFRFRPECKAHPTKIITMPAGEVRHAASER